jgi:hypothetical protein
MKLTGLLARTSRELPGVTGMARVDRRTGDLLRRIGPGDIVVLNQLDLDRRTADALVAADVAGVVNASVSISGRYPNLGPELLVSAGIPLIDGVGEDVLRTIKEGTKLRLHDGAVYLSGKEVAKGVQQTPESVADQLIEAKAGMSALLEAFSANTIEFLRRERTLVLDGIGVPEVYVPMKGREVLVAADAAVLIAPVSSPYMVCSALRSSTAVASPACCTSPGATPSGTPAAERVSTCSNWVAAASTSGPVTVAENMARSVGLAVALKALTDAMYWAWAASRAASCNGGKVPLCAVIIR